MPASERDLPARIGRYAVLREIGRGAMGRVLLARDPVLERDVAIKLLRKDLGISDEQYGALMVRMRQEARASARVQHPHIVTLHDMGEDAEFGLYLVFEYVEGPTLKQRLVSGPLGTAATARLARELGGALTAAHALGVVHRDVKPENVILTNSGSKIADFGIARVPESTLTRDGKLLGTPAYSAPESIVNGLFSPASDQFSLATTLYEALGGRRAFPGSDAMTVARLIATEDAPPLAASLKLAPHVDSVLRKALSRNPEQRFTSTRELGEQLARALQLPRAPLPAWDEEIARAQFQKQLGPRTISACLLGITLGSATTAAVFLWLSREEVPAGAAPAAVGGYPSSEPRRQRSRPPVNRPSTAPGGNSTKPTAARPDARVPPLSSSPPHAAPESGRDADADTPVAARPAPENSAEGAPPSLDGAL